MNKDLRRILELSGVAEKSSFVDSLYENYSTDGETLRGLDGPFKMPNGRTVYYDLKEHKYYDKQSGVYLNEGEAQALTEKNGYNPTVILHARRGDETVDLRLESIMEIKPMMSTLRSNGYDDFEMSDGEDRTEINSDTFDDDEHQDGEMVRTQMDTMKDNLERLCAMVDDGTELPAWVQSKITKANDYLDIATDYLDSESPVDPDSADGEGELDLDLDDFEKPTNLGGGTMKTERALSKGEKKELEKLKDKYDDSDMKDKMKKQYGDDWERVYYGYLTKKAKKNETVEEKDDVERELKRAFRYSDGDFNRDRQKHNWGRAGDVDHAGDDDIDYSGDESWNGEIRVTLDDVGAAMDFLDRYDIEHKVTSDKGEYVVLFNAPDPSMADEIEQEFNNRYYRRSESYITRRSLKTKLDEAKKKMKKEDDPCWDGYEMVGMKKKNGKEVPNCVPKEESAEVKDTSKTFSKGDKVQYKGKEVTVEVPDGPANMVGIKHSANSKVDMVKASELKKILQDKKEVTEGQETYSGWKKAVKKKHGPNVEFEGDKDICQAFVRKDGKRHGVGEWDGDRGELHEAAIDATVFGGNAPFNAVDDQEQKDERTGRADRTGTKVKVPKAVMKSIDKRVSEIKKSIERYDDKGYNEKSVKQNAIESLEQIKTNLARGDHEGFMHAQIFFGTLMSPIWDLIPAEVVNFLATGRDSE